MGILVGPSFTTMEGFLLPSVYLAIETMEFKRVAKGSDYVASFRVNAYKEREGRFLGTRPLMLNNKLRYIETVIQPDAFYFTTPYAIGYDAIKECWTKEGYTVKDVFEEGQKPATSYIYDTEGYDYKGFNAVGLDREGYNREGFNGSGVDREGYNREGYNQEGYNRLGFNIDGFNKEGFNSDGYDIHGFDANGYNEHGFDREGYNKDGYNEEGYNREGFDSEGYNALANEKEVSSTEQSQLEQTSP
jgi:hypothetical protein